MRILVLGNAECKTAPVSTECRPDGGDRNSNSSDLGLDSRETDGIYVPACFL